MHLLCAGLRALTPTLSSVLSLAPSYPSLAEHEAQSVSLSKEVSSSRKVQRTHRASSEKGWVTMLTVGSGVVTLSRCGTWVGR